MKIPALALAVLLVGVLLGRFLAPVAPAGPSARLPTVEAAATIWTCSMHPHIQQSGPGACPICGMDLIPLETDEGAKDGPRTLSMSAAARALADIQTTIVSRAQPTVRVRLVGKLAYDETRQRSLTARFPARIDELFVNYTGIPVVAGQHLARVYSPELLTAQRELLTAYSADANGSITRAARDKLRLWDLLPEQIDGIIERGSAQDHFELRAPIGGVVVARQVQEGDYVKTGEPLFRIVDLSELWLRLDAFESDLAWLRYGQTVDFTVEAYPGETFTGQIVFIEPEVNVRTRTVSVRVEVPNEHGRLKPGMFARGVVEARIEADGRVSGPELEGKWISPMHPEIVKDGPGLCDICGMKLVPAESLGYGIAGPGQAPLLVPASSVLRTGRRAVVYVQTGADRPTYEGREILLGPRAGDQFVVAEGLAEGERVVTRGAFKIDSALQIQAKPSMMNPSGGGPAQGARSTVTAADARADAAQALSTAQLAQLLDAYLQLQSALAADGFDATRAPIRAMMEVTGHSGPLAQTQHAMQTATTLDEVRNPHFVALSNALIAAVRRHPEAAGGPLVRVHCPMALDNEGADWLQRGEAVRNPYLGMAMLECGTVEETILAARGHDGHGH